MDARAEHRIARLPHWMIILQGCLLVVPVSSQITLQGKVLDASTGLSIPYAGISVAGTDIMTVTNNDGEFQLSLRSPMPCTLLVQMTGYQDVLYEVMRPAYITLYMEEDIIRLEKVEVVARAYSQDAYEDPKSRVSIDQMDMRDFPGLGAIGMQREIDEISSSPAFKVINTRGFNSAGPVRMLQLIDGVDNQSPGLNFSLGNFLGASELDLQRVEVIAGASSPSYGPNAFNGAILMKTLDPFLHPGMRIAVRSGERRLWEGAIRYAHVWPNAKGEDQLAFKINLFALKVQDWEANNMDPVSDSPSDLRNPGGYNAVNRYGDESSVDYTPLDFYPPLRGLGRVHRTGYTETDVVDYDTYNLKGSASVHVRLRPHLKHQSPELIFSSAAGGGTTVYQGDNRFSLRDIRFYQHRIEWRKADRFYLRGYLTHEHSGRSYDPYFTALRLQQTAADDIAWFNRYTGYWQSQVAPRFGQEGGNHADSVWVYHQEARHFADQKHVHAQDSSFNALFQSITRRLNNEEGGTRFYDRSALFHLQGEYTFHPRWLTELKTGGQFRVYMPDSKGTIFHDTSGTIIRNQETGWFVSGRKRITPEGKLVMSATLRMDKNQNFKWVSTQAVGLTYEPAKETIIRLSVSSALRNPTLTDQYMYLNVGPAILSGHIAAVDSLITIASFREYQSTLDLTKLQYFSIPSIQPEKVRVAEAGVRARIGTGLYIEGGYYRNWYRDFLGYQIGIRSDFSPPPLPLPQNTRVFRYSANSASRVTTEGASIGLQYFAGEALVFHGNYTYNQLRKSNADDPIIPAFNTPRHKYNLGMRVNHFHPSGRHALHSLSFSINYKWVEGFRFEGSPQFTGDIPSYGLVDARISYVVQQFHATFQAGASNVLNNRHIETYGGPSIGRLAYIQLRFDLNPAQKP